MFWVFVCAFVLLFASCGLFGLVTPLLRMLWFLVFGVAWFIALGMFVSVLVGGCRGLRLLCCSLSIALCFFGFGLGLCLGLIALMCFIGVIVIDSLRPV